MTDEAKLPDPAPTTRDPVGATEPRHERVDSQPGPLFADSDAFVRFLFDEISRITP